MPRWLQRLITPILFVAFVVGVLLHGTTAEAVLVELKEGAEEPRDGGVLGMGGAPDYRLEVDLGRKVLECATYVDTRVGDGLRFEVPGPPPRGAVLALKLVEDDAARDDVLEEVPVEGDVVEGVAFRFTIERGWSLGAGVEWFLGTPVGVLVGALLAVGVVMTATGLALRSAVEG